MSTEKEQLIQTESVKEIANPNNNIPEVTTDIKYRNLLEVDQKTLPGYLQKLLNKKKNQKKDLKNELRKLTLAKLKKELGIKDEGDLFDVQTNIRDRNIRLTNENLENLAGSGDPRDEQLFREMAQQEYMRPGSVFGYSEASPVSFDSFRYGSLDKYLMAPPQAYAVSVVPPPAAYAVSVHSSAASSPKMSPFKGRSPSPPRVMRSEFVPALSSAAASSSGEASSSAAASSSSPPPSPLVSSSTTSSSAASSSKGRHFEEIQQEIQQVESNIEDLKRRRKDRDLDKDGRDYLDKQEKINRKRLSELKAESYTVSHGQATRDSAYLELERFGKSFLEEIESGDQDRGVITLGGVSYTYNISNSKFKNINTVNHRKGLTKSYLIGKNIRENKEFQITRGNDPQRQFILLRPSTN